MKQNSWWKIKIKLLYIKEVNYQTPKKKKYNCTYRIYSKIIEFDNFNSLFLKLIELWPERENSSLHTNMQYLYDILKITILVIDIKHMKDNLCLIVAFIIPLYFF